jgi:CRISPR system Cascade subunit CasD
MHVLLMRMSGILQSWGWDSRFLVRGTDREPSKSGVVGVLCAALGRGREDDIEDLASLRMGVRTDFPGVVRREYQTSLGERGFLVRADGGKREDAVVSERYYLNEADFLVGLEGPEKLLSESHAALKVPRWHLSLGRKSYAPLLPVWIPDGLVSGTLEEVLKDYPWPGLMRGIPEDIQRVLKLVIETENGPEARRDQPVSFALRIFQERRVTTSYLVVGEDVPARKGGR